MLRNEQEYFSAREFGELIGFETKTIVKWVSEGKIPSEAIIKAPNQRGDIRINKEKALIALGKNK